VVLRQRKVTGKLG
jgi:hypothetical protein